MRPTLEHRRIQDNVTNSPISRIHVNTWEYKDHSEWMDQIYPGDQIVVNAIGSYDGSIVNVVEFVRMDIYCAC